MVSFGKKKESDMTQEQKIVHYDNGTVLLIRPDKTEWFGLAEHLQYHLCGVQKQ